MSPEELVAKHEAGTHSLVAKHEERGWELLYSGPSRIEAALRFGEAVGTRATHVEARRYDGAALQAMACARRGVRS